MDRQVLGEQPWSRTDQAFVEQHRQCCAACELEKSTLQQLQQCDAESLAPRLSMADLQRAAEGVLALESDLPEPATATLSEPAGYARHSPPPRPVPDAFTTESAPTSHHVTRAGGPTARPPALEEHR